MTEFVRRQRECPNLVVKPWFGAAGPTGRSSRRGAGGFVVEYCPGGVESVELAVGAGRVRAEGPGGVREARLDLSEGWLLEGHDRACPVTLANHLLRLADQLLDTEDGGEAA
jgi:hypothetical protein